MDELTPEEMDAISAIKRLSFRWPESLMLFSWSGSLKVIRRSAHANGSNQAMNDGVLATIDIPNDGGDP